jgi:putative component of toxin-antitoxin plasmid stabilization module
MYNFTLERIEEIDGKVEFFKLIIDGHCELDDFLDQINSEGNLRKELITIQIRMQLVAECRSMPDEKFKDITPKGEIHKEYEIKTKNLRVYMFHEKRTGRIVVCGGKKSEQQSNLIHFRNVKKQYFLSL